MHRQPGIDHELSELLADGFAVLGDGRYESLHVVGELEGEPVVTFTSPERMHAADHSQPSAAYLATMARGLVEGHGWGGDRVAAYLLDRPGIGAWAAAEIRALVE